MRLLAKLTLVDLKLFLREPLTVLFSLALPLILLFILGGVFGNEADPEVYAGIGPMSFYVPAYVALVAASVGLISVPVHLAENRERGVLRRYQASGVPVWAVAGAEIVVSVVIATVSALVLVVAAVPVYDFSGPDRIVPVVGAFLVTALTFAALGVLLGAVLPTARAAQALGILLWFVMLLIGGAGPPEEVLSDALTVVAEATPLKHSVAMMQDGWNSIDPGWSPLVVVAVLVGSGALTVRFFRWE